MPTILIVEKNGNIKPTVVKNVVEADFYKKAGFKSAEGFSKHTTWKLTIHNTQYHISLYGKITGKANTENKFEFPPPVDSVLFFGNCVLANVVDGVVSSINEDEWEQIYQYLYGGFESLSDEDEDEFAEEEDDEELNKFAKTKDGYAKDGFIVDDDEEEFKSSEDESELSSEDSQLAKGRRVAKPKKPAAKKHAFVEPVNDEIDAVLDCTSELSEDSYD